MWQFHGTETEESLISTPESLFNLHFRRLKFRRLILLKVIKRIVEE